MLFVFISTPIIGILSDKYGRRPLLILSLLGTSASFFLMAFAPSAIFLFIARALDGLTAGNIPVAQAVISDSTEGKDRARGFGIIGACFGIGFIAGPAISAFTVGISIKLPFIIAGVTSHKKLFDFKKLAKEMLNPNTGSTLLITFLWAFGFGMFIYAFQPFSLKMLHLTARTVSLVFVLFGAVGLISQLFIVSRMVKSFGTLRAFTIALTTLTFSFILLFFTRNLAMLIVASIIMGLSNSTVQTLTQTVLSQETPPERQGEIMGINASYMSIGQILGPVVGGSLALLSVKYSFFSGGTFTYPFLAGGILLFIAMLISRKIVLRNAH